VYERGKALRIVGRAAAFRYGIADAQHQTPFEGDELRLCSSEDCVHGEVSLTGLHGEPPSTSPGSLPRAVHDHIFAIPCKARVSLPQLSPNQRLEKIKQEYAERFQTICRNMSATDFEALVDEMARFRLKYEELEKQVAQSPPKS
jgi:hypothetical protein